MLIDIFLGVLDIASDAIEVLVEAGKEVLEGIAENQPITDGGLNGTVVDLLGGDEAEAASKIAGR